MLSSFRVAYLIGLLACISLTVQAQQQQQPDPRAAPAAKAVCAIHIAGHNTGHIVTATVACSRGSITVGADNATVRSVLQKNSTGVTWTADPVGFRTGHVY